MGYFFFEEKSWRWAKKTASAMHMLRIVPHTVPRVGRSYEHFPDGFELHLLPTGADELGCFYFEQTSKRWDFFGSNRHLKLVR